MCDQWQSDQQIGDHGKAAKHVHVVLWAQKHSCATLKCHLEAVRGDDDISVKSLGGKHQSSLRGGDIVNGSLDVWILGL